MTKPNVAKKRHFSKVVFSLFKKKKTKEPHTVVESVELSTQMFYLFLSRVHS